MTPEYLEKRVRDIAPMVRTQLLSAFYATAHPDHLSADQSSNVIRKLDGAVLAKDRAAILDMLGISADGTGWNRLDEQVQLVLSEELLPLFSYVRHDAFRDLAENSDDFDTDKSDFLAAIDTARATIVKESLDGILAAIDLILAAPARFEFNAAHLISAIGMTPRQVQLYFAAMRKAAKLQGEIAKNADDIEKQVIALQAGLKGVPAFIGNAIRRIIRENRSLADFSQDDTRTFSKALAGQLRRYRAEALAKLAVTTVAAVTELSVWRQAKRLGIVGSDVLRYWETANDERVRHVHEETAEMNAAGVELSEPFKTPLGQVMSPPLELGCRCTMALGNRGSKSIIKDHPLPVGVSE